jgi:hypothetical protein
LLASAGLITRPASTSTSTSAAPRGSAARRGSCTAQARPARHTTQPASGNTLNTALMRTAEAYAISKPATTRRRRSRPSAGSCSNKPMATSSASVMCTSRQMVPVIAKSGGQKPSPSSTSGCNQRRRAGTSRSITNTQPPHHMAACKKSISAGPAITRLSMLQSSVMIGGCVVE